MFYFLDNIIDITSYSCKGTKFFPVFQTVKFFIVVIQIAVPFALIIWGSLDWFKALIAHDEKEMRIKRKPFVTRVIFAMLILILPAILQVISKQVADTNDFWKCYSEAKPKIDFSNFKIDENSEGLSGTTSSTITTEEDKNVISNCGLASGEKECKKSKTSTNNCKWKSVGTGGYCTEGDLRLKCNQYSYTTCPRGKKDDYGNTCDLTEPKGSSTPKCDIKTEKKNCTEYSLKTCPNKDDYGKICITGKKEGSSAAGCRYKKCTDYTVDKCPSGKKDSEGKVCAKVKEKGAKEKTCGYKK